ncbi:MAG TPA: adenine phosphoribosyltransferase, partial [Lachnospiraceae bacterium]|nr:adenine phosphoribosyltransferase [Lachnospiraceae bacterium]
VTGLLFLMELAGLQGRERLKNYRMESAIIYDGK